MKHDEAMVEIHFDELVRRAIEDYETARERRDGPAMQAAAIHWERAENYIPD
jgi:hypothetical protein